MDRSIRAFRQPSGFWPSNGARCQFAAQFRFGVTKTGSGGFGFVAGKQPPKNRTQGEAAASLLGKLSPLRRPGFVSQLTLELVSAPARLA
ncbi:MAG TPA: hypothetical protein VMG35_17200 [Bryobacteraceae bacterium]|nr:hypothetical protein [Bryobacteraceae bacterium]